MVVELVLAFRGTARSHQLDTAGSQERCTNTGHVREGAAECPSSPLPLPLPPPAVALAWISRVFTISCPLRHARQRCVGDSGGVAHSSQLKKYQNSAGRDLTEFLKGSSPSGVIIFYYHLDRENVRDVKKGNERLGYGAEQPTGLRG